MQERVKKPKLPVKAHEKMRIAGKLVDARGAHRGAQPLHRRRGRHGGGGEPGAGGRGLPHRQRLQVQAHPLRPPEDPHHHGRDPGQAARGDRPPDHRGVRAVPQGLALRGRARLRRLPAGRADGDPRRQRDLLLRHHSARQGAPHLHLAHAGARLHLGHHAVQSSAQHDQPQDRAGDRHQQPRGGQADRADAADRAAAGRHPLRGGPAAARCCRSSPAIRAAWAMR